MKQLDEIEINLYDCLNIIKKYKKVIVSIIAGSIFVSFGMVCWDICLRQDMFKMVMYVEPGSVGNDKIGEPIPLDSVSMINKRIKNKVYHWKINKEAAERFPGVSLNFDIYNSGETNLIEISSMQKENSVTKGIELMNYLFVELHNDNRERLEIQRREIRDKVKSIGTAIKTKKNMLTLNEKKLELSKQRKDLLYDDIKRIENNINELGDVRKKIAENGSSEIYMNFFGPDAVLTNISRSRDLKDQYDNLLSEKEKIVLVDEEILRDEIENLEYQKNMLSSSERDIYNIKLFKSPQAEKVISNKWRFYPVGGVIAGLIIGLFIAISMESWRKYKPGNLSLKTG